ncbi:hypothetical protein KGM_205237 [Danaus plexippus plexippus]|uniref:Uncharacterized protein n=1 Tax=Danaus plexippus plexippus TaxID=278856 RepID=A0A212F5Q6_DANPL|nr:hypothetical protein KGM_205237 [Danaus plexippus plexippus]
MFKSVKYCGNTSDLFNSFKTRGPGITADRGKLQKKENKGTNESSSESEDVSSPAPPECDLRKHHNELAHGHKRKKKSHQGDEVSLYPSNPVVSLKSNPFAEWDDMKSPITNPFHSQSDKSTNELRHPHGLNSD